MKGTKISYLGEKSLANYEEAKSYEISSPEAFISKLMDSSVKLHKEHLMTNGAGSYAKHNALGVYSDITSFADEIAEAQVGCSGERLKFDDICDCELRDLYEYVVSNKHIFNSPAIRNKIDELAFAIEKALFKLEQLS